MKPRNWVELLAVFIIVGMLVLVACVAPERAPEDQFPIKGCPSCGPAPDRH